MQCPLSLLAVRLIQLWRIDPLEPDLVRANVNCITINDPAATNNWRTLNFFGRLQLMNSGGGFGLTLVIGVSAKRFTDRLRRYRKSGLSLR